MQAEGTGYASVKEATNLGPKFHILQHGLRRGKRREQFQENCLKLSQQCPLLGETRAARFKCYALHVSNAARNGSKSASPYNVSTLRSWAAAPLAISSSRASFQNSRTSVGIVGWS